MVLSLLVVAGWDNMRPGTTSAEAQLYQPPLRGAPASRVGGGTRGKCSPPVSTGTTLSVLTPEHTGFTLQEQPHLYWFLSEDTTEQSIEINLIDNTSIKPLFETHINPPVKAGFHRIRLADYQVRLVPGVRYQWSVALICDTSSRSLDIVSSGAIQMVDPQAALSTGLTPESIEKLRARLGQASAEQKPSLYASAGLWYEALASLSELIEANPKNDDLRQQRAALFEEVALTAAAAYDRQKP